MLKNNNTISKSSEISLRERIKVARAAVGNTDATMHSNNAVADALIERVKKRHLAQRGYPVFEDVPLDEQPSTT